MVELRLWYLSLPKHASMPDGVEVGITEEKTVIETWKKYAKAAEQMNRGLHDLTPPAFRDALLTSLLVHDNFHGIHKVDQLNGARAILEKESTLKYMTSTDTSTIVRIPEDLHAYNVFITRPGDSPRLYYMLRWLQSPTQDIVSYQRELVGAGVGTDLGIEPKNPINQPERVPLLV